MNIVTKTILGLGIALSTIAFFGESGYSEQKFFCDEEQQSTIVRTHWGELPMIRWIDDSFPPPWTPLESSNRRFQQAAAVRSAST